MGAKHSYGAVGRGDTLNFMPETLKVITDPKHPLYDARVEREPDEALIVSIMRNGIIVPLVISRDGENVYVTDGRQRRAAAIEANKRLKKEGGEPIALPCVWKRGDEAKLYEIAVTTNELRSGDSPLERARKMQHFLDLVAGDEGRVALAFGCTIPTVINHLKLLECAPAVQKAVEAGQLAATVAKELSKLPREEQKARLDEMVSAGETKGRKAKERVKGNKSPKKSVLTPKQKVKVIDFFTDDCLDKLSGLNKIVAKAVVATLHFVDGDAAALDGWGDVGALVREALMPKEKPKKEKKSKKKADKAAA